MGDFRKDNRTRIRRYTPTSTNYDARVPWGQDPRNDFSKLHQELDRIAAQLENIRAAAAAADAAWAQFNFAYPGQPDPATWSQLNPSFSIVRDMQGTPASRTPYRQSPLRARREY